MPRRHKDTGLRLLSYARVSAVRGRDGPGFISESDQFARNRSYAETYGHTVIEEGSDLDVSGGVMSRPTFDRFLGMIARSKADGIIVAKLDRFARSNVGALAAVDAIEDAGGTLISVAEQLDASTGAGRFLRSILFAAAEWERDRIGDQWRTSRTNAVERGIHVSHHVPPGYVRGAKTNDPQTDRRLYPDAIHADTVREAFKMASEGVSHARIADFLNERELPIVSIKEGEKPTHWQTSRISRLLADRVYLGEARSGKKIVNAKAHEPLVDEETWLLAQRASANGGELRRPNRDRKTGEKGVPSILSGIVRCAGCSFAMKPQSESKTSAALYRCQTTSVSGRCPSPSTIKKGRIEDYVIKQFLERAETYFVGSLADEDDEQRALVAKAAAAERSYRAALTNVELRAKIGDDDHDRMVAALYDDWQTQLKETESQDPERQVAAALPEGISLHDLVEQLRRDGRNEELRSLLASGIEAVFVRPAQSRAHNLPVAERVRIVFVGDEELELPTRGHRFEPRSVTW